MRGLSRFVMVLLAAASTILFTGCASSSKTVVAEKSAGTQLLELKEAKDKGIITEKDYERMRKRIVRDND